MIIDQVFKFGGKEASSMTSTAKFLISKVTEDTRQSVAISAMRSDSFNTTDKLIFIGELLNKMFSERNTSKKSQNLVFEKIEELRRFHIQLVESELIEFDAQFIQNVLATVHSRFDYFRECVKKFLDGLHTDVTMFPLQEDFTISSDTLENNQRFSILGFGEVISAEIFSSLVNELAKVQSREVQAEVIDTNNLVDTIVDSKNDTIIRIFRNLGRKALEILERGNIAIVPGYVYGFKNGIIPDVGRSYTDLTASLTAVGLQDRKTRTSTKTVTEMHFPRAEIEGILSMDPRKAEAGNSPKLVRKLSYFTAREITGGASVKALHPDALRREVQNAGIVIKLYNPSKSDDSGTIISQEGDKKHDGVMNVSGKKALTFSVNSGTMSGYGYFEMVSSVLSKMQMSIGIVSTSETEITLTVDDTPENRKKIKGACEALSKILNLPHKVLLGKKVIDADKESEIIMVRDDLAIVYCIGENMKDKVGLMADASFNLMRNDINIEGSSQATMQRAMVFIVATEDVDRATNILHKALVH